MNKENRLCLWCEHFYIHHAEPDYSTLTTGSDFDMGCRKSKWFFDVYNCDEDTYRNHLTTAWTCTEYKFNDAITEELLKNRANEKR